MGEPFASKRAALVQELQALESPDQLDEPGRWHLTELLSQVRREVQPKMSFMLDLTQSTNLYATVRVGIAVGLFDALAAGGSSGLALDDINLNTQVERALLVRILRLLAIYGIVEQVDERWRATSCGSLLTTGTPYTGMAVHFYFHVKSHANLLYYLQKNGFRNPSDYLDSPWQGGLETSLSFFDWMKDNKEGQESFNSMMPIIQGWRGQDWYEFFPVEEKIKGTSATDTILVDVGGGLGHDTIAFRNRFPHIPGRVVLQDLPHVIDSVPKQNLPPNIDIQVYDAFTPQTIRGARIYYMRVVLHDWPNKQAIQMLNNIGHGMDEHSVLLIYDGVMPEKNSSPVAVTMDFIMMNAFSAMERTEVQWRQLFEEADFDLVKTWRPTQSEIAPTALFELVPKRFRKSND